MKRSFLKKYRKLSNMHKMMFFIYMYIYMNSNKITTDFTIYLSK